MKSNINKEQTIVLLKEIKKLKEELKLQDKTIFSVLDMVLTSSHPNTFKPIIDFLFEKNYISRGQLAYFEKVNEISAKASFEEILIDTIPEGK